MTEAIRLDYDPDESPTLSQFHADGTYFRMVRGPAGSGKTYAAMWEIWLRAIAQAPAPDGVRYSRALIVRNTYGMLRTSTLQTFKNTIGPLFKIAEFPTPRAVCAMPLSDGTSINIEVVFQSFDSEESVRNALGLEFTYCVIDEISSFDEQTVLDIIRRCGRYPSGRQGAPSFYGVWAAMNGPPESHFLAAWEDGRKASLFAQLSEKITHTQYFRAFAQPAALLPPIGWSDKPIDADEWAPNPEAENVRNIPGGYGSWYAMLGSSGANIRAYVLGEYAPLQSGKLVFPEFNKELHIIEEFKVPVNWPIYLSFDFGRTPVCGVATATPAGRLIIVDIITLEDASVSTLAQDFLLPLLRDKYKTNPIKGAWGDPAGSIGAQSVETSPYEVLLEEGIPIEDPGGGNKLGPRIESVKKALTSLDGAGKPILQVVSTCIDLVHALSSAYIYEKSAGANGVVGDKPTKTHVRWASDLADMVQYLCLGYYAGVTTTKAAPLKKLKTRWL